MRGASICANGRPGGGIQRRRPCVRGPHLRRVSHGAGSGPVRRAAAHGDRLTLRHMPQRRRVHAALRSAGPGGPVSPVPDQHARPPHGRGRDARRDVHRLPRRAWRHARPRCPIARRPAQRHDDVCALPWRRQSDEGFRAQRGAPGRLGSQRARGGAAAKGRYVGAHVRGLSWKPRRDAARDHLGGQRLRAVPPPGSRTLPGESQEGDLRRDRSGRMSRLPQQPSYRTARGPLGRRPSGHRVRGVPRRLGRQRANNRRRAQRARRAGHRGRRGRRVAGARRARRHAGRRGAARAARGAGTAGTGARPGACICGRTVRRRGR